MDKNTLEVKYGSRAETKGHIVGPWDWTDSEDLRDEMAGLMLESVEGFVAVEEKRNQWALYFDRKDDGLKGVEGVEGKRCLSCSVERREAQEKGEGNGKEKSGGRVVGEEEDKPSRLDWS